MRCRTRWCKGTWQAEQDDPLALEQVLRSSVFPVEGVLHISIDANPCFEYHIWDGVTCLDGSHPLLLGYRRIELAKTGASS